MFIVTVKHSIWKKTRLVKIQEWQKIQREWEIEKKIRWNGDAISWYDNFFEASTMAVSTQKILGKRERERKASYLSQRFPSLHRWDQSPHCWKEREIETHAKFQWAKRESSSEQRERERERERNAEREWKRERKMESTVVISYFIFWRGKSVTRTGDGTL